MITADPIATAERRLVHDLGKVLMCRRDRPPALAHPVVVDRKIMCDPIKISGMFRIDDLDRGIESIASELGAWSARVPGGNTVLYP